jgi:hypothetical protein
VGAGAGLAAVVVHRRGSSPVLQVVVTQAHQHGRAAAAARILLHLRAGGRSVLACWHLLQEVQAQVAACRCCCCAGAGQSQEVGSPTQVAAAWVAAAQGQRCPAVGVLLLSRLPDLDPAQDQCAAEGQTGRVHPACAGHAACCPAAAVCQASGVLLVLVWYPAQVGTQCPPAARRQLLRVIATWGRMEHLQTVESATRCRFAWLFGKQQCSGLVSASLLLSNTLGHSSVC